MSTLFSVLVFSCNKENMSPDLSIDEIRVDQTGYIEEFVLAEVCGPIKSIDIVNPNGKVIGEAFVYNTDRFFYLSLVTSRGFEMRNVWLHLAGSTHEIPLTHNGYPSFREFRYRIIDESSAPVRTFKIPLSELNGYSIVTARAEARQTAIDDSKYFSAWIDGKHYGESFNGRMFTYEKTICYEEQGTEDNEEM